MSRSPIIGPAYNARSPNLASDAAINIFAEIVEAPKGEGAEQYGYYSRPGLNLQLTVGTGPERGMWPTDFGCFGVSGNQVFVLNGASLVPTILGTIGTTSGKVSIVNNPTQVAFFDGSAGYMWSAATGFMTIALPFSNPGTAVYQDGFAVVNQIGTFVLWQSNLNDMTTWDPLNFDTEDGSPDDIIGLVEFHRQIVVMKELFTAFWVNAGTAGFVFQRLEGVYLQRGCVAPESLSVANEIVFWLGQGPEGQGSVYLNKGYEAVRISSFALEYQIGKYATITDAIGFSFMLEGHTFYVLTFPTGNATWVFDVTLWQLTNIKWWYQWGAFASGNIVQWAPSCQASYQGLVLVGDYSNGNIYSLSMDALTDNGAIKKCLRSWRSVGEDVFDAQKINFLDLECDTGLQVPPGANPQYVLRQSFDGGQTWSAEMYRAAGQTGEVANDVRWNRLGATRRGLNSDRVFELSTTDQFRIGWLGAEIR